MDYVLKFLIVLCLVFQEQVCSENKESDKIINLGRHKREDRWSWGSADGDEATESYRNDTEFTTSSVPPETSSPNPCAPYDPPVPDFRKPDRRISESKCYEYIWHMKLRAETEKKNEECRKYLTKTQGVKFAIGGRSTSPGEFPHMGAIGWKAVIGTWIFKCGSSLISNKYLLTAAHCSRASNRDTTIADTVPKIVRLGDKNIADFEDNGQLPSDYDISNIIVHPDYKSPKKYNDIALIELSTDVRFDKYTQPACLWRSFNISRFNQATLTGWGVIEAASLKTSPELQAAVVDFIDSQTCDTLLRSWCNRLWCGVQDSQVCAGKLAGGVDACQGDSGGPLQVKIDLPIQGQGTMNYIIGVTSFGIGCARPNIPGIYTRVSYYLDWIENIVWPQ